MRFTKKIWVLRAISVLLNVVSCLLALWPVLLGQDFFGAGDTYAFVYWTIPLAVGIAASGSQLASLVRARSLPLRLLGLLLAAAALTYGWVWVVYLVLGAWINAFSFPVFYPWLAGSYLQLLFLSWSLPQPVAPTQAKYLLSRLLLIPVVAAGTAVVVFGLSFAGAYLNGPAKELYLIPAGFQGNFRVVYGQACGLSPVYEQGRRVLPIPIDGILLIKPAFEAGRIDNEYYMVGTLGRRQRIKELLDYRERKVKSPGVLLTGTGVASTAMPNGSSASESPMDIHYTDFWVSGKDTSRMNDHAAYLCEQKFDSLMRAKVEACQKSQPDTK